MVSIVVFVYIRRKGHRNSAIASRTCETVETDPIFLYVVLLKYFFIKKESTIYHVFGLSLSLFLLIAQLCHLDDVAKCVDEGAVHLELFIDNFLSHSLIYLRKHERLH